ncbi:MarR family transcriptional regulator [Deinococcus deserti]|uniref:Putative Transcriptional regulator, MarR family n=1 Tax=Deinococcus deserti (strain DSM 17065 / CIP 109153 / LMG 22923 / VCD115) TaxID=546414 RepID=C1CVR4_DEIDV|nr:MarR family transcriptional regulator [Deinococcus deserti]ACO46281.1 putative Transcriptional regulator, MarR family [Deinococcus deserti VCD115]
MNPSHPPPEDQPEVPAANREAACALGNVMKQLHRHISSQVMHGMQAELVELDLSFSQMTALHQLRAGGESTVTELAARTRLSVPAASHLVERLVQRGLAARTENPGNRREKVVTLTAAGLDVLGKMDRNFRAAYVSTFARLQPEAIQAAAQHIQALLDELETQSSEVRACKEVP